MEYFSEWYLYFYFFFHVNDLNTFSTTGVGFCNSIFTMMCVCVGEKM